MLYFSLSAQSQYGRIKMRNNENRVNTYLLCYSSSLMFTQVIYWISP